MFHLAFLLGSYISTKVVLTQDELKEDADSKSVLRQLNYAHILVPLFNFLIMHCELRHKYVLSKVFETVSIFQYQATIFYA